MSEKIPIGPAFAGAFVTPWRQFKRTILLSLPWMVLWLMRDAYLAREITWHVGADGSLVIGRSITWSGEWSWIDGLWFIAISYASFLLFINLAIAFSPQSFHTGLSPIVWSGRPLRRLGLGVMRLTVGVAIILVLAALLYFGIALGLNAIGVDLVFAHAVTVVASLLLLWGASRVAAYPAMLVLEEAPATIENALSLTAGNGPRIFLLLSLPILFFVTAKGALLGLNWEPGIEGFFRFRLNIPPLVQMELGENDLPIVRIVLDLVVTWVSFVWMIAITVEIYMRTARSRSQARSIDQKVGRQEIAQ
jgi:hypothetical protein